MVGSYLLVLFVAVLPLQTRASVNFNECLDNIKNGLYGPIGLDSLGQPVNASDATSVSYENCILFCGSGQEPFRWSTFSEEFSSWLLPWLALVSQIPFGANDKLLNLESMLLTVGSPSLAAYSLILTLLNGRWITRRFSAYRYPNVRNAVRALSSLQQSPLRVTDNKVLLASLIVLPHNDDWWEELVEWLDYGTYSWSISAATSIAWVVIAYVFTVIGSFIGDITDAINSNGQGVGSLWLWLLPIVVGWLQVSPKCDSIRLRKAIDRANGVACVAQDDGDPEYARNVSEERAIYLDLNDSHDDTLRIDEQCTAPIYNYARFLPWVKAAEEVAEGYRVASYKAQKHKPVARDATWVDVKRGQVIRNQNRVGNSSEVLDYCGFSIETNTVRSRWGPHTFRRMFIASLLALMLQWGTTGAAVVVNWFTPTNGLGCRSGSYVLYGVLSTIAWIFLVTSSILSYYSMTCEYRSGIFSRRCVTRSVAILLRRAGKLVASLNAIWIVVLCLFQFTNFFDRCYCNSSVFSLRGSAYNVISPKPEDLSMMRAAWSGGVGLASGTTLIFAIFVTLLINPTLPE